MCGRYLLTASPELVARYLDLSVIEDFPPRTNIAPTQPILVAANDAGGRRTAMLVRWGLVPSWVKDPSQFTLLINARAETAADKPAFRAAMRHRRVLVPASGFYEWRKPDGPKGRRVPYLIRPVAGGVITFGGLMEVWHGPEGEEIPSGLILTTGVNSVLAPLHDRMPVLIAPEHHERWLDCLRNGPADVADLMLTGPDEQFEAVPITDRVNRAGNEGPALLEEIEGEPVFRFGLTPPAATPASDPAGDAPKRPRKAAKPAAADKAQPRLL